MASPVQIILNPENFEEAREGGGGGPRRDFFANDDQAFRRHKDALVGQLTEIARALEQQPQGDIGVIKVILRREAWAKSHRPNHVLFKRERIRSTGGGDLGEMYFEARPRSLRSIATDVASAEAGTNLQPDRVTGKLVPHPSVVRSETGAIERIELYGPSDRANFSAESAVSWLRNPMTGSSYQVELFDVPPPRAQWDAADSGRQLLYASFVEGLAALGQGLEALRVATRKRSAPELIVRLNHSAQPPLLRLQLPLQNSKLDVAAALPFDANVARHQRLLNFLLHHPLVRRVELPPVIKRSPAAPARSRPRDTNLPVRSTTRTYPRLGVVDGGLSNVLSDWIVDRWDILADEHINPDHGTFIGGLAVAGSGLNGNQICAEADGAELVDLAIFPDEKQPEVFRTYYPNGPADFFAELENAVADMKARFGTRVFNLSLNIQYAAQLDRYSPYAAQLDAIAEATDAVFVVSVGNIEPADLRAEWPADETQALVSLASARNDGLLMPAESVRNISVAALNPVGLPNVIGHAPARYSRRGPGLRAGVKPDLAHFGGSGSPQSPLGHGLFSVAPDGGVVDGCGTSYAAPLVAKTAAALEHGIEGEVSRETLISLLLHHAQIPDLLGSKALSALSRDLVGFGKPPSTQEILEGSDHQITLVLATRIRRNQQMSFRFAWPASLVTPEGKCRGRARLTLVSTPPLDTRFGAEFLRVNIDAALQQEHENADGKTSWRGRLQPIYLPDRGESPVIEAERIEHDLKWSPVKAFTKTFPRGVGNSSNWRLFVSYLTRADEVMPEEGVPFTAILTISDPDGAAPVFNDARALLQRSGVRIEDIRTAARVTTRV